MNGGGRRKYRSTSSAALKKTLSSYGYGRTFKDTKYDILGKNVPTSMRLDSYRGDLAKAKSDMLGPAYKQLMKPSKSKKRGRSRSRLRKGKSKRRSRKRSRPRSKGRKGKGKRRSRKRSKTRKRRRSRK